MREVTFSGRWLYKKRKGRHTRQGGKSGWKIFSALAAAGLIMTLLLSTAFAATATRSQAGSSEFVVRSSETNTEPELNEESDPDWIEHIRVLKVEQQRVQQVLEPERLKAEQEKLRHSQNFLLADNVVLTPEEDKKAQAIDFYLLEHGSPMVGQGRTFVQAGKMYGVDPALVVAIAGKESSWGKYCFLPYNAWGWGTSSWSSWEEAISSVTCSIGEEYIAKGLDTIHEMAPIYCPPSNGSWERDVTTFYFELLTLFNQFS